MAESTADKLGGSGQPATHAATSRRFSFDPDRLAYLEVAGLRAYYDHRWFDMLKLVVELMHEQFNLSWLRSIQAAYYVTVASIAWAPADNKPEVTRRYIRKFYRLAARRGSSSGYDPRRVAAAEFKYWVLHRRRGIDPQSDVTPYVQCLTELHSALFGIPLDEAQQSAVNRALGTDAIDRVTGKRSKDIEADWREAEKYLGIAYRSVAEKL
jgi:hypothetical protein